MTAALRELLAMAMKKPAANQIGFAALYPWLEYRFASAQMTPRFDQEGRIYMLICDNPDVARLALKEPT